MPLLLMARLRWLVAATAALTALLVGADVVVASTSSAEVRAMPAGSARPATTTAEPAAAARPADRQQRGSTTDAGLEQRLARRMSRSTAGNYGLVVDVEGVGRVAAIRPHHAFRPASTQKLFTTLPLLLHQPDRRLVTTVNVARAPRHGVVHGNLVVRTAADPSLTKTDLSHLAHRVRAAGVRRVTGQLRLDIGSLSRRTRQAGWKRDFVPTDIGPLSPFPVARDWWRTDAGYLARPTRANLALFRNKLAHHGVHVVGRDEIVRSSGTDRVLAGHRSRPIHGLVDWTLTWSDNFYAETLLQVAGGHRAVSKVAADAGITDPSEATDGSGLSYDDRETAAGEVALLTYAHGSSAGPALRRALPVACRTGTLKDRFCGTAAAGKVFAKTGTLDHSRVLAGYTTDALGRLVTFSVICSKVHNLTAAAKATDRAVLLLRGYRG